MPKVGAHSPGSFCWFELATTDQDAAKQFYAGIFGWDATDFPMGDGQRYTMFQSQGQNAAAAFKMSAAESAAVPPHWTLYIAVASASESAKRAEESGGTRVEGPFDVQSFGRMAVLRDPTGAYFNVWEPGQLQGVSVKDEVNAFCWANLHTTDPARASQFYERLFGWRIGAKSGYPADYQIIEHEGRPVAGIPSASHLPAGVPPHWNLFFRSAAVDDTAVKAKQLGGKQYVAPMNMGGIRLAVLADPQGAAFSILQPPGAA